MHRILRTTWKHFTLLYSVFIHRHHLPLLGAHTLTSRPQSTLTLSPKEASIITILFPAQSMPKALTDNSRRQAHNADRSGACSDNHAPKNIRPSLTHPSPRPRSLTRVPTGTCKTPEPNRAPLSQTPVSDPRLPGPGCRKVPAVAGRSGGEEFAWPGRVLAAEATARKTGSAGGRKLGGRGCERAGMRFKIWL